MGRYFSYAEDYIIAVLGKDRFILNGKTVWIVSQDASFLDARPKSLSRVFAESGWSPVVITPSYEHSSRKYLYDDPIKFTEPFKGAKYVYLRTSPAYKRNVTRVLNMIDFCRKVRKYEDTIAEQTGTPDFIVASLDNPFMPEAAYKTAKKFGAKFLTEIRDIWPLSLIEIIGVSKWHPFVLLIEFLEKRAFRRSDAIVSSLPFASKYIEKVSGVNPEKVSWMPNGIDTREVDEALNSDSELPADLKDYLTQHKCFVYAGSIVKSECIDYLLKAWEFLKDTDIHLAIIGDGGLKPMLQDMIQKLGLEHVKMFPAVPRLLLPKALGCALGCASYRVTTNLYQYGLSINKLNDYLYSGKPVIFACSAPNVVQDAGHFAIPTCEPEEYAQKVLEVSRLTDEQRANLAEKGRSIIKRVYDYQVIGQKYISLLESLR